MREIELAPSAASAGARLRQFGPYTDPRGHHRHHRGLPPIRAEWVMARGDVEAYDGRHLKPEDNGLKPGERGNMREFPQNGRKPVRAKRART